MWGGGNGVRRVGYGQSTITCYLAVATRHHQISAISRIQIVVSHFLNFKNVLNSGLFMPSLFIISLKVQPAQSLETMPAIVAS